MKKIEVSMKKYLLGCLSVSLFTIFTNAEATTVTWADWTLNTSATIGAVNVTYAGELSGLSGSYPSWNPATTWADGSIVSNAPSPSGQMVQLVGGRDIIDTLTFSTPVVDPVFAIWSLGAGGIPASFVFNQTPTFVAGGPSAEYGGSLIGISGSTVSGSEGNGTVQFLGTFSSLSWTNPQYEGYYGFTVGIPTAVPEPETYALMLAGLGLIGFVARRSNPA
jgi:hypothetical protein